MKCVDSLRKAAQWLESNAQQREDDGGSWLWIEQDRRTAALLRAVASEAYRVPDYGQGWMSHTQMAAEALSDLFSRSYNE